LEHTFETSKGFRSGFGKPCAPPAIEFYEALYQTASTSLQRPSFLGFAFSILEQVAGAIDRRQTRDRGALAQKRFQAVLEI
jgi:hypothetical protein